MSIAELRQKSAAHLERLRGAIQQQQKGKSTFTQDENDWQPTIDQEKGVGFAEIRLVPCRQEEDLDFQKYYEHSFAGPTGKKYYARSLTSLGQKDPVGELNSRLWNSGVETDKDVARSQKRKTRYVVNVYVINDPAKPENNGKVKKFRHGVKLARLWEQKLFPEFEGEKPTNPFCLFTGNNITIRAKLQQVGDKKMPNYDASSIESSSDFIGADEAKLKHIQETTHELKSVLDPSNFKDYATLQGRLLEVLGPVAGSGIPVVVGSVGAAAVSNNVPAQVSVPSVPSVSAPRVTPQVTRPAVEPSAMPQDEQSDEAYFKSLMGT